MLRKTLSGRQQHRQLPHGSFPKKIQIQHEESVIQIPRDRNSDFEPVAIPKHQSRGLSIERLVISLYAKGMSVFDIEDELRNIYGITLDLQILSGLFSLNRPLRYA